MSDVTGDFIARDINGVQRLLFKANVAELWMFDRNGQRSLILGSVTTTNDTCKLHMGKVGVPGGITLSTGDDDVDRTALEFNGKNASISVGTSRHKGDFFVNDQNNKKVLHCDGANAHLIVGGVENSPQSKDGRLSVRHKFGVDVLRFNAETGQLEIGNLQRGPVGRRFLLDGGHNADLTIGTEPGGDNIGGRVFVKDQAGKNTIFLDGPTGHLSVGTDGNGGRIFVKNQDGSNAIELNGNSRTITVAGDIILKEKADLAEEFDVEDCSKDIEPGVVLTLSEDGYQDSVSISDTAYDSKVVGVYSGAGLYKPGLILDRKLVAEKRRVPVAMMGKVYCKVDASGSAIKRGDLLVSSDTPGHAMKAIDPVRSVGSILGKALRSLDRGKGLVPILAMLQ